MVLVLGPTSDVQATKSIVETGRTFAELLADEAFHEEALMARNKSVPRGLFVVLARGVLMVVLRAFVVGFSVSVQCFGQPRQRDELIAPRSAIILIGERSSARCASISFGWATLGSRRPPCRTLISLASTAATAEALTAARGAATAGAATTARRSTFSFALVRACVCARGVCVCVALDVAIAR